MIKNSDLFYSRAAEFQSKRKAIIDDYERQIARLEDTKGSKYYTEKTAAAATIRDTALKALKREYGEYFRISLDAMSKANDHRTMTPPTPDQIAILQVLKLRGVVDEPHRDAFQKDLERAANTCADNPMCISVINDIARQNGFLRSYHSTAKEMSQDAVSSHLSTIKGTLADFMEHDTSHAARIAAKHNAELYGKTGNERPLPKRPLFEDKAGCFSSLTHGHLSNETLSDFCDAVDAE